MSNNLLHQAPERLIFTSFQTVIMKDLNIIKLYLDNFLSISRILIFLFFI